MDINLKEIFPNIEENVLDLIYRESEYNVEVTIETLCKLMDDTVITEISLNNNEHHQQQQEQQQQEQYIQEIKSDYAFIDRIKSGFNSLRRRYNSNYQLINNSDDFELENFKNK